MAQANEKTFQCELIGPTGKLLDCRTSSVVLPAHDGQVGILHNHMPMLSQLGLGVMRVAQMPEGGGETSAGRPEMEFFVDGGFALVAENSVTVIAYDALALQDAKAETIQSMLDRATRNLAGAGLSSAQQAHENERLHALRRVAASVES
ncbi:MAG: ATP synthase F1 subunit epsilon [Phycisphaerales bacterium]